MPTIENLQRALKDEPVAFLLVSDESAKEIEEFIARKEWGVTSYRSEGMPPPILQASGIPATFILNRHGLVVFKHVGMARWDDDATLAFIRNLR